MSFVQLTADTTLKTADSTVLTADMTQYEVADAVKAGGLMGIVPSRVQKRREDEQRDLSARVQINIALEVTAEARGKIEHVPEPAQIPVPAPKRARTKPPPKPRAIPPWRVGIFAALGFEAKAEASIRHPHNAVASANFGISAEAHATGSLEPELMSTDVLLALLTALDDHEESRMRVAA